MRAIEILSQLAFVLTAAATVPLSAGNSKEHKLESKWVYLADVEPGAVQEHGTAATSDELYVIGGVPGNYTTDVPPSRKDVSAYNFRSKRWRSVAPLSLGMTHANAATVHGKVYVLGGLTGSDVNPLWNYTSWCSVYDPETNKWSDLPRMPEDQARGASAIGVYDSTVYLAGGMRSLYLAPGGLQDSVDIVTAFNVRTRQWATLPPLPEPRDHVGGAVIGSKFYVVGGRNHGQDNPKNTTWVLDLEATDDGWKSKKEMPTARGGIAIGTIGHHIVTFGGEGNAADPSGVFPQTEAYDTVRDEWVKLDDMPNPRHGTAAASVDNAILIPGGGATEGGANPLNVFTSFTF